MTNTEKIQIRDKALKLIDSMLSHFDNKDYRMVFIVSKANVELGRFKTAKAASKFSGVNETSIGRLLRGELNKDTIKGYSFETILEKR